MADLVFASDVEVGQHIKGEVVDGSGTTTNVSTVWLGLDHGFGSGRLEIFETMVFGGRYACEATLDGDTISATASTDATP